VPERVIEGERDGWILVAAHSPDRMPRWMALKREQLEDPEVVELYQRLGEVIDWQPDDPRLPEFADPLAASISKADDWEEYDSDDVMAVELVELVDSFFVDAVPVARRLPGHTVLRIVGSKAASPNRSSHPARSLLGWVTRAGARGERHSRDPGP